MLIEGKSALHTGKVVSPLTTCSRTDRPAAPFSNVRGHFNSSLAWNMSGMPQQLLVLAHEVRRHAQSGGSVT